MASVSKEGNNTDKMVNHQLLKKRVHNDSMKHEEVDLVLATDLLDPRKTEVYNANPNYCSNAEFFQSCSFGEEVGPSGGKTVVSDTDNQLLIKYFFKERVNLSAVKFHFSKKPEPAADETEDSYAPPGLIKLYVNHDSLDFTDLESVDPIYTCNEVEDEKLLKVPAHKSQRIETLYIFIEEGNPAEALYSFVNQIELLGYPSADYHAHYRWSKRCTAKKMVYTQMDSYNFFFLSI